MGLAEYQRKRRFDATPEPRGRMAPAAMGDRRFVVQLHHASVRHYDFRLEVDGVLRSWSVPKGPSFRPGEKRLAVEVEDHPLDYAGFEGLIPEGQYGAGHVAVFDRGTWAPVGDPGDALRRGRLEFELFGDRLKGRWNLIRTGRESRKPQWLLLKRTDGYAGDVEADDLLDGLPTPPQDAPGASRAKGERIRAARTTAGTRTAVATRAPSAPVAASTTRTAARRATAKSPEAATAGTAPMSPKNTTARTTVKKAAAIRGSAASKPATRARRSGPRTAARAALVERARTLSNGRRATPGEFVEPMLTIAAEDAPAGEDWLHEWKWDGYRLIAAAGAAPQLWSRNGLGWNERVPELVQALAALGIDAALDGELIAVDANGYSTFNGLQQALKDHDTAQLRLCVFDLMRLDGYDLTQAPLIERKALLRDLLDGADPRLFYSTDIRGQGPELFRAATEQGMEGIISKRADSRYLAGRSERWLKVKAVETRDFIVVGYTDPKGSRKGLGALLLAQRANGQLGYAGRVGSGLGPDLLRDLPRRLEAIATDTPAVALPGHLPRSAGRVHWVRPQFVVEVLFRGWSKEGLLRQATFHRLREDKPATEDTTADRREAPLHVEAATDTPRRASRAGAKAARGTAAPDARAPAAKTKRRGAAVSRASLPTLSSPGKVLYPDAGYTKQQVFDYYLAVADRLLPEIRGRLLSIVRCPGGIGAQRFFQKHAGPGFGDAVRRLPIVENDGDRSTYFYIDDLAGLMSLVQMNTVEFHPWGSTVDDLERPDRMIFDLDPDEGLAWSDVKAAAREVRERLMEVGLASYPKLTGGKGVHVVAPLKPQADWERVRTFCDAFAEAMTRQAPDRYVATMSKARREGRIFIDWLRNGRGATGIATWSLRAREGAPASVPLTWDELARVRAPNRYTLRDAPDRDTPAFIAELVAHAPTLPG